MASLLRSRRNFAASIPDSMGTPPAADSSAASAGAEGAAAGAGILNMDDDFLRRVEIDVVIPKMCVPARPMASWTNEGRVD